MFCCFLFLLFLGSFVNSKNVVVLVADDMGFEISSLGNPVIQTPNMDKLVKQSLVYENAFTTVSSCSPSRSTILTGIPNHQNGMYGLHNGYHAFNSFEHVKSLPAILKQARIRTGIIGKKHVGPESVYPFDFAYTEENESVMQVGRNISRMKQLVDEFLTTHKKHEDFFLYIGFHDPHRCGHTHPQFGNFCEKFGDGTPGMGTIADWSPRYYHPLDVVVPPFVQDTPATRSDIAAQYTTISRLDQGVGLVLQSLHDFNVSGDTMVMMTSDNGIPFPNGRTNLYRSGSAVPFMVSSPLHKPGMTKDFASLLDITPTILDWFNLPYPKSKLFGHQVHLAGRSLLRASASPPNMVFGSHSLHEITMYYPMRSVRTTNYSFIENLNYMMPFPIDQDFYLSPSFQDLLKRESNKQPTHWFKSLNDYYYRKQYELYDVINDPLESKNLAYNEKYAFLLNSMKKSLQKWQNATMDPWRCSPMGVLEDAGPYKSDPQCFPLNNGIL